MSSNGCKGSGLPPHWKMARLGEIGEISGGSTPSTKVPEYWDGEVPWLTPSEVTASEELYLSTTRRTITTKGLAKCAAKLLPIGTVMMTSRATIGEVAINAIPMATNQGFINVVCDESEVVNEFLAYWIIQQKQVFEERAHGVTFKEITRSNFKTISIRLPPLPEQRAIARTLRAVQDAIQARRHEVTLERERKAALMQHLFTHGMRGEQRKQTDIGEMPQSWEVAELGQVATLVSGGTPSKARSDWWKGDIPWASPKDLKRPRLTDVQDYITREAAEAGSRIVSSGTVFIVIRGMILAKDIPVAIAKVPMAFNQDMKAILPGECVTGDFILYVLQFRKPDLSVSIGTSAHGTRRLGTSSLDKFQIPLPSVEEQQTIAAALEACDITITLLEEETALLEELFRAMLEELMTGRLSALPLAEMDGCR